MLRRFSNLILLVLLLGIGNPLIAQREVTDVNIEDLSDEQIQRIISEMNARGLTMEQAIELARARGASQQQINQMTQRIRTMKLQGYTTPGQQGSPGRNQNNQYQTGQGQGQNGQPALWSMQDSLRMMGGDTLGMDQDERQFKGLKVRKDLPPVSEMTKRIFGFYLFNRENLTFEPSVNIPMPADYVIGVGDEIVIQVWGASQQSYNLVVENSGAINIPDLGPVVVANQNYSEVRSLIKKRLTAIYSDMRGANPGTFSDVTVRNLRSIKVNVIGEAILPGTYTVPATASAFNVLYLSGGPNENGSFRHINVLRDNKLLTTIDVYDYLINGNTAGNISLRDQDILFIPTYSKRVETVGAFKRRAIFELKEGESIPDLIRYSGGFVAKATESRLLITRFNNGQHQLIDVEQIDFAATTLKNGDLVRAERVIDRFENRVSIEGAVFRPGSYALEEGMTLSQLIKKAEGLREDYFSSRGLIIRLDNQLYPTTIPFNVEEVLAGKDDPVLQREDQVIIRDIFTIGEKKTVRIYGEVIKPGEYDFHRNMNMKDLIFLAGGMTEAASESYVEVARRNSYEESVSINDKMASLFQFKIDRNLSLKREDAEFRLEPFDQVYIRKAPSYREQKTVFVGGEVQYPGEYSIVSKNERISDVIKRAGGVTPSAHVDGAKLRRFLNPQLKEQLDVIKEMREQVDTSIQVMTDDTTKKSIQLELRLGSILKRPRSPYDYFLRDKDSIFVPMKSEEIWVTGEVLNPIGLAWEKGKRLRYYINRSGGFGIDAKKSKAYVVYSNGTSQATRRFLFTRYPTVKPGSQIVVPSKPPRRPGETGRWIAITSALSSLAIAAAAVFR